MVRTPPPPVSSFLGHSFVRRLKDFINIHAEENTHDLNFNLSWSCEVITMGRGGSTVDRMICNDF